MKKTKLLHIDDSSESLEIIVQLISSIPDIEHVGSFTDVDKGIEQIKELEPDIVLLDIEMPGDKNGFTIANEIKHLPLNIVFLSSHGDYALNAFEACAVNYIVKPCSKQQLIDTVERCKKTTSLTQSTLQEETISELIEFVSKKNLQQYPQRIYIVNVGKTIVIQLSELITIESSINYTIFTLADGKVFNSSKHLKIYADILQHHPDFVRVSRSFIINKNYLESINREGKTTVFLIMKNKQKIEIAAFKREQILNSLQY